MESAALMAISPLDGRYQDKVNTLRHIFSEFGLIKFRIMVEIRWLEALAECDLLPEIPCLTPTAKKILHQIIENFSEADALQVKTIESEIKHDVKAVEYFIKEKISGNAELSQVQEFIHFGCTSEDINNLAYGLMMEAARRECLLPQLDNIIEVMKTFTHSYASLAMLSRTHGQAATPTTVGKEFANVLARIQRQRHQLSETQLYGKLNGATGNYNAMAIAYPAVNWPTISQQFVNQLGLTWNAYTTQIEPHDSLVEFFAILLRINTILIDFNRDVWSYISLNYFTQKSEANEVGSSTMPHKVNPIDFENAEGNLGIANALLEHMISKLPISRWQRDLSDSTVLRNIGVAVGHAMLAYQSTLKGMEKLAPNQAIIEKDLNEHWEVLGEAIQTVMRKHKLLQPYEKLKAFTRGKPIDKMILQAFITELSIPEEDKQLLLQLTPSNYIGYAETLAKTI